MSKESSSFPWTAVLAIIGVLFVSVALFVSRDSKLEVVVETAESASEADVDQSQVDSEQEAVGVEPEQSAASSEQTTEVTDAVPSGEAEVISVE